MSAGAQASTVTTGYPGGQGRIGGGLLIPLAMAIALDPFPKEERARAIAVVGVPTLLAPVVGPNDHAPGRFAGGDDAS